jgi:hypothetical protein
MGPNKMTFNKKEYQKEYQLKNQEYLKERRKKYKLKNKKNDKKYRLKNKERIKEYRDKYYRLPGNKERKKEWSRKYYLKNIDRKREIGRKYYQDNKECAQEYRLKNKEHIKKLKQKYYQDNKERINRLSKERRRTDINFKIKHNLRTRLRKALKGINKSASTMELIGCTIDELRNHIESQFKPWMTWKNYGLWDIDHVKAMATFDLTCPLQQRECCNWNNLQPMDHIENIRKGAK